MMTRTNFQEKLNVAINKALGNVNNGIEGSSDPLNMTATTIAADLTAAATAVTALNTNLP